MMVKPNNNFLFAIVSINMKWEIHIIKKWGKNELGEWFLTHLFGTSNR